MVANTGFLGKRDQAVKDFSWALVPSGISKNFIQYNFDYCGRVMYGDMNWPDSGLNFNVKSCDETVFMNGEDPYESKIDKNTRELYPVENIYLSIKDMYTKRGVNDIDAPSPGLFTTLKYSVSGFLPGLSSGNVVNMTKPKTVIPLKKILQGKLEIPKESSDMYTEASAIEHGPNSLPVFQTCQLLMVNSDEIEKEMNSIIKGTFKNGNRKQATERVYEYMFGHHDTDELQNVTVLYKLNALKEKTKPENEPYEVKDVAAVYNDMEKALVESGALYMACSVQAQGLPPVVALKKASKEVEIGIKFNPAKK